MRFFGGIRVETSNDDYDRKMLITSNKRRIFSLTDFQDSDEANVRVEFGGDVTSGSNAGSCDLSGICHIWRRELLIQP